MNAFEVRPVAHVVGGHSAPADDFREMGPRGAVREPSWPTEMLGDYWRDADSR
ncbi:hypothetical protein [Streptomyces californicus]|uniref:hypothetical protein n=1 Tax=Streptomyces californicus TaxID=67351 RepID=UPI0037B5B21A